MKHHSIGHSLGVISTDNTLFTRAEEIRRKGGLLRAFGTVRQQFDVKRVLDSIFSCNWVVWTFGSVTRLFCPDVMDQWAAMRLKGELAPFGAPLCVCWWSDKDADCSCCCDCIFKRFMSIESQDS